MLMISLSWCHAWRYLCGKSVIHAPTDNCDRQACIHLLVLHSSIGTLLRYSGCNTLAKAEELDSDYLKLAYVATGNDLAILMEIDCECLVVLDRIKM